MPAVYIVLHDTPDSDSKTEFREYERVPVEGEILTDIGTEDFYEVIQVVHRTEYDHAGTLKSKQVDVFVLRTAESPLQRFRRLARERQKRRG